MPQLKSGQIAPGQNGAPKLYGVGKNENSIPFQERLMRLFKAQEYVTIKNVDTEPCYWQYMPQESEHEAFSEDGMQKIITRETPEMWMIMPGDTEVLVGASAYRALDVMYKNYTSKATLKRFRDPTSPTYDESGKHLPKNFNFADGGSQDSFIELAFIGKAQMVFESQPAGVAPPVAPASPAPEVPETAAPVETPPADDLSPKPKTTDGAPLETPQYAQPEDEQLASDKPKIKSMKEVSGGPKA